MKEGKHSDGENAQAHVTMRHTPSPSGKSQATHTSKTPTDDEDQMHEDEEIQHAVRNASKSAAKGAVEIDGQAWAENRKSSTMPTADHTTPTVKTKRDKIIDALENKYWQGLVGTFTVLALYGDDIRILAFFKEHDIGFYSLFFICLIIFSAELTAQSIAVEGYKWSFFFCLDLIATASLLPDIPWLLDLFVGMYSTSESEDGGGGGGDVGIARAGRAARVGTRAGRIVRLVKLVDVVRKINPADLCASPERKAELRRQAEEAKMKEKQKRVQASRLGKILADQTTRRVIVGVLSMMMVTPLLEYENTDSGPRFGLELLYFARSPCSTDLDFLSGAEPNAECMQRLRDGVQNPGGASVARERCVGLPCL
jgi:hypothetical protein